jgi:signal transduction histidine kinase
MFYMLTIKNMLPRTKTVRRITGIKYTRPYKVVHDSRPVLANADLRDTGEISGESALNIKILDLQKKIAELTQDLTTADDQVIFLEAVKNNLNDKVLEHENATQALRSMLHELNNIMLIVQCDTTAVLELIPKTNTGSSEIIDELLIYSKRMAELVRSIMLFSKERKPDLKQINLKKLIIDLVKPLQRKFEEHQIIFIDDSLPDGEFEANADKHLLIEAVLNLIKNAVEATPKSGKITISLTKAGANFICISIRDTGCGIPKENLEKIFEPNFSTKRMGHGIGLANVKKTIEAHKGFIRVKSQDGDGTEFFVFIPVKI